jgi:hypothetical protein
MIARSRVSIEIEGGPRGQAGANRYTALMMVGRPPEQPPRPRPYVIVTGSLFALIALAHLARTIDEWRRFQTDPWFALEGPGLGLVCGALAFWAWRVLRASRRG